ncbi:MAG: family 10 glycosylhydrolase [Oscillospiraceae bacterium]|nr:family 10 glycosylhydrolase [Oscillospiraceae bacterium]
MKRRKFIKKFISCCMAALAMAAAGCAQVSDEIPGDVSDDRELFTDISHVTDMTGNDSGQAVINPDLSDIFGEEAEAVGGEIENGEETERSPVSEPMTDISRITETVVPEAAEGEITEDTVAGSAAGTAARMSADISVQTSSETASTTTWADVTVVKIPKIRTTEETLAVTDNGEQYTEGGYYPTSGYYPLNFNEQKAVWFSYLEYDRLMRGKTREEFTSGLGTCFDNAAALGINTIYFQVRAYGDAYYRSDLFPTADRLTGDYDPLEIAVKEAHDRGLSIHAWVNPMRLMTDSQMAGVSEEYLIGQWYASESARGTIIVNHSGRWYLSPAYREAVSLICNGISEIVTGYNVDGVQIDDYFYPTTDEAFDKAAYESSGSTLPLADWRREIVTEMVRSIYSAVHSANPKAVFGISPSGNVANDRDQMYADVEKWLDEAGCCDYICPQIYYGFENDSLPFAAACDEWSGLIKRDDIKLVIGLAAYKSGLEDKYAGSGRYEWQEHTDILARQQQTANAYSAGVAFFRYDSLFLPDPAVAVSVTAELEGLRAMR